MNKRQLELFVNILKESNSSSKEKSEKKKEKTAKKSLKSAAMKSTLDLIEERFWVFLLFVVSSIYFYLVVTGKRAVLGHEKMIFNESRVIIDNQIRRLLSIDPINAAMRKNTKNDQQQEIESFMARPEFQINWDTLQKEEERFIFYKQTCEEMKKELRQVIEDIHEQYQQINEFEPKQLDLVSNLTLRSSANINKFSSFERLFIPTPLNANEKNLLNFGAQLSVRLNQNYNRVIKNHFGKVFKTIFKNLFLEAGPYQLARTHEKFIFAINESLKDKITFPLQMTARYSSLKEEIDKLLKSKQTAINQFESVTFDALSGLIEQFKSVPDFPKVSLTLKEDPTVVVNHTDEQKLIMEQTKVFDRLYSNVNYIYSE